MTERNYFPCPICRRMLLVELTKNEKPYCKCNDCGVQLFIRGKEGIIRFLKLLGKTNIRGNSRDLINAVDYFNTLNELLEEIRAKKPIFGHSDDLNLQEKVVLKQLALLRKNLQEE
jgi:hypothetical protein